MAGFVTQIRPIFYEIFKIFVVINQKLRMWCMELKIGMIGKHHRHSKHTKFCQNLRGSFQFFGDWAWNDPFTTNLAS